MSLNRDLVVEKQVSIASTPQLVWDAITDPEKVRQYFFGTQVDTDWKPGSPIFFSGEWEGKSYKDRGRILNVLEPQYIQYSYYSAFSGLPDNPENYSIVTYQLEEKAGKTEVKIEQRGFANEQAAKHGETGWEQVLSGLKALVEG